MLDRQKAVELVNQYVKTPHIITHSYAVEAVMGALAQKLAPDEIDQWAIAGLLHDLDEDEVDWRTDMSLHGPRSVEILKEHGYGTPEMYSAILCHNKTNGSKIKTKFDRALYAADPITGFINAIALVYPDKKVKSVKLKSILKRMGETRFAAGANREAMYSIEEIGVDFEDFAQISLDAMCGISEQLGL